MRAQLCSAWKKIQQSFKLLNQEKADTTAALEQAKGKVNEQNKKISELDAKIQEAVAENDAMEIKLAQVNDMYSQAQNEVNSLTHSKLQLTNEIDELEKTTEALRKVSSICVKARFITAPVKLFLPVLCVAV